MLWSVLLYFSADTHGNHLRHWPGNQCDQGQVKNQECCIQTQACEEGWFGSEERCGWLY